jgi:DNA-binding MarR family transcriptional regulator
LPTIAPPLDIDTTARLRTAIARIHRHLRRTAAGAEAGLTPTGISILQTVVRQGPIRLSQLADAEGVNPTMLSRVVADLGDAGLLTRVSDPEDRRAARAQATREGRRLAERMRQERTDALSRALAALSGSELARLERALPALEELAEALKEQRS